MNLRSRSTSMAVFLCLASISAFGQEDMARQNGLPSRIGGPSCTNSARGGTSNLQGSLNVQGIAASEKPPTMTVSVFAAGVLVSRQKVKNGGSFSFFCIPKNSVTMTADIDSIEIANYSLGQLSEPPSMNRQDLFISWTAVAPRLRRRAEVISARNAYQRSPENRKLFEKAMNEIDRKNGEPSAILLEQLLTNDPLDFAAWTELGLIQSRNKKPDAAIDSFQKAIAADPSFLPAVLGLARVQMDQKEYAKAIVLMEGLAKTNTDSADLHHLLGEAYLNNRQGSLAIVHMNMAIDIAPTEKSDLHLRIAALYHAAKAKHMAAAEYSKLLAKSPNHPNKTELEKYIRENAQSN